MKKRPTDVRDMGIDPPADFKLAPRRIALVAVDWYAADKKTTLRTDYESGFDPFLSDIAVGADAERCDAIVYALWSHDVRTMGRLNQRRLFSFTSRLSTVILEVADSNGDLFVEVWRKGIRVPHRFMQRFGTSAAKTADKQAFMDGLPARQFGKTLFLVCGEANIISTKRRSRSLTDYFQFMRWLAAVDPKLIINPTHDYMRRPEMKKKEAIFSKGGRTVLSVWNRGNRPPEAVHPWQAFVDGKEVTERIREVPFAKTDEIRIGVFDV